MSTVVKDLGAVSAYAYAVEKGYTGTEAEFAELMADYAEVGQRAEDAAESALNSKTAAQTAATTATNKASEATTAAQTATTKAGEASTSASTATSAKDTAVSASQTATTKATEATTAAATATSAATTATTAKDDAVSAKTAAQAAQTGAETAAASVQSSAAQIATNATDISQLKEDLSELASQETTAVTLISTGGGHQYILTNASIGATISLNPQYNATYSTCQYAIVDCSAGDRYHVTCAVSAATRAWAFIDANNKLLAVAQMSTIDTEIDAFITAPIGANKAIFNDYSGNGSIYNMSPFGRVDTLEEDVAENTTEIENVKNGKLNNNSLGIQKTNFLAVEIGSNLHDPSTDVSGAWYTTSNGNVILQSNQYTTNYTAVMVMLPDELPEYITVSANSAIAYMYAYYMIGSDAVPSPALSSGLPKTYVQNGYSIAVPTGSKAVCMSIRNATSSTLIMVNVGDTKLPIEPYAKKYLLDGNQIVFEEADKELIKLPSEFHAVVGDPFELFYSGIANVIDSNMMEFDLTASEGKAFKKKYMVTPSQTGTIKIDVVMRENDGDVVETGSVDIVSVSVPSSPGTRKNILCIGDSLTQDGVWCAEVDRRLTGNGGSPTGNNLSNISFIGTKYNGSTGYEGYGGWSINSYLSAMVSDACMNISGTFDKTEADQHSIYKDANNKQWKLETIVANQITIIRVSDSGILPSSGTLTWVSGGINTGNIVYTSSEQAPGNPFWNASTGQIDFTAYAERLNVSSIDYAVILLGWNSTGATEADYKAKVTQFITALQTAFPVCKVILLGLQVPSRNGLANNYGTTWKYYTTMQNVWKINKWYSELAETIANVRYVNLAGQFDSEHGYPTMVSDVNTRSTETEELQTNGIHPNTSGKYQIADAVYRELCALLQ